MRKPKTETGPYRVEFSPLVWTHIGGLSRSAYEALSQQLEELAVGASQLGVGGNGFPASTPPLSFGATVAAAWEGILGLCDVDVARRAVVLRELANVP